MYSIGIESYGNDFRQALLNMLNNAKDAILEKREKERKKYYENILS